MTSEVRTRPAQSDVPKPARQPRPRPVTLADIARLDSSRAAVMRGRVFSDSTDLIEQAHEEMNAER